jgi:hypothetical protein
MKNKNRSPLAAIGIILFVSFGLTGVQAFGLWPAAAVTSLQTTLFYEPFADNSAGWMLENEWQIGPALASVPADWNPDPGTDTTPTTDNGVAGIVIGGNASIGLHEYEYLTSPVINTDVGGEPVTLKFNRWLNSDYAPFMQNDIEVWDGNAWVKIFETQGPPAVTDFAWMPQEFDLTPYQNPNLQVRFGTRVMSGGAFTVSSWNIDDLSITTPFTPPPPPTPTPTPTPSPSPTPTGTPSVGPPTSKDQCKAGGWQIFNTPHTFKNQGACIQFVNNGH